MATVASSSPIGFRKYCGLPLSSSSELSGQGKSHCKPTISSSKSELFGGDVCLNLEKSRGRGNGGGRLPAARVVSPKAVSDSISSQTCLDPDANSVCSLSLSLCV